MTDQQALEHIDQRMTEARDAEGRLSAKQATIDMTRAAFNEAGVLSGPLPERVRKLSADLRDVTADRDHLRAERTQVREMLDGAGIASDTIPAAVAMLLKERAEWRARTPPAPDVAPGGVEWRGRSLFIGGEYVGHLFTNEDEWYVRFNNRDLDAGFPDVETARAVLLALAGQECGRVEFGLRESATVADLLALQHTNMWFFVGAMVDDLREGAPIGAQTSKDPASVREWVAHGQAALTIEAVPGV